MLDHFGENIPLESHLGDEVPGTRLRDVLVWITLVAKPPPLNQHSFVSSLIQDNVELQPRML